MCPLRAVPLLLLLPACYLVVLRTVFNAGSGSVVEMVEWLDSTKVLYGLVRMAL